MRIDSTLLALFESAYLHSFEILGSAGAWSSSTAYGICWDRDSDGDLDCSRSTDTTITLSADGPIIINMKYLCKNSACFLLIAIYMKRFNPQNDGYQGSFLGGHLLFVRGSKNFEFRSI